MLLPSKCLLIDNVRRLTRAAPRRYPQSSLAITNMRLVSFQAKSFKSIIDTGVCHLADNDNIIVLAGQNEAGKSAIIEALAFFGNGPSVDFDKLHRRKEEIPEVICGFILSAGDVDSVFTKFKAEKLKQYLLKNPQISLVRRLATGDDGGGIAVTEETRAKLSSFLNQFQESTESVAKEATSAETSPSLDVRPTVTQPQVEAALIECMKQFVFYDSFKDLLPGVIKVADIDGNSAVQDFQRVFKVNFAEIVAKSLRDIHRKESEIRDNATDDLNEYWTQHLEKESKYTFLVSITQREPIETSTVEFMIDRTDNDPLYLEQKSNGFRWFSAFNLRLRALGVAKEAVRNLVIMIDEPGQGLHETAQQDLKRVIEEIGHVGAQVIYTTHYPNLIGTKGKEFTRIRLVSNTIERGTRVETVSQFASRADIGAADALSPIRTAMGIQSIGSIIDPTHLSVLVEGVTDHYYLSALQTLLARSKDVRFLPACGANNVPNVATILLGWGLPFLAVLDDDANSGRKAYNLLKKEFYEGDDMLAHEHVLKLAGCGGIEDVFSSEDFYSQVLGIERPTAGAIQDNSSLANGKKELLARVFLDKATSGSVQLDTKTTENAKEIFDWLDEKAGLLATVPTDV